MRSGQPPLPRRTMIRAPRIIRQPPHGNRERIPDRILRGIRVRLAYLAEGEGGGQSDEHLAGWAGRVIARFDGQTDDRYPSFLNVAADRYLDR